MTANLNVGNKRFTNVALPVLNADAVNENYEDNIIGSTHSKVDGNNSMNASHMPARKRKAML
jgi:hypothetical protein